MALFTFIIENWHRRVYTNIFKDIHLLGSFLGTENFKSICGAFISKLLLTTQIFLFYFFARVVEIAVHGLCEAFLPIFVLWQVVVVVFEIWVSVDWRLCLQTVEIRKIHALSKCEWLQGYFSIGPSVRAGLVKQLAMPGRRQNLRFWIHRQIIVPGFVDLLSRFAQPVNRRVLVQRVRIPWHVFPRQPVRLRKIDWFAHIMMYFGRRLIKLLMDVYLLAFLVPAIQIRELDVVVDSQAWKFAVDASFFFTVSYTCVSFALGWYCHAGSGLVGWWFVDNYSKGGFVAIVAWFLIYHRQLLHL